MEKNQKLWLVTIPNRRESPDATFNALQSNITNCKIHRFEIPSLTVGTLDSLMALSDDLTKINGQVENVVRKIERQYADLIGADGEPLRAANEMPMDAFLRNFQWDYARYRYQGRQLQDIVSQVQTMVTKADDELKKLSITYHEKVQAAGAIQRKRTINLITSDFEDFLAPEQVARFEFLNTEYLQTVAIVVPSNVEQDFLKNYESLGSEIAAFGGTDWTASFNPANFGKDDGNFGKNSNRGSVRGSPVVPGTAVKFHTEGDNHLYAVTLLKGQYVAGFFEGEEFVPGTFISYVDTFRAICKEKRLTVRDFEYDPSKAGGVETQIEHAKWEVQQTHTTIVRWCRAHFGEVFSGFIHLKVILGFVESVLRYGLPVDFLPVFIEPNMKKEKKIQEDLTKAIIKIRGDVLHQDNFKSDEEDDNADESDSLPYVCHKFTVVG